MNSFWQSLCEAFAPAQLALATPEERKLSVRTVKEFVVGQLSCLPLVLRFCLSIGMQVFRLFVLLTTFVPFESHEISVRKKLVESWAYGKVALARQLFRPVRSLVIFAFYEEAVVVKYLQRGPEQNIGVKN